MAVVLVVDDEVGIANLLRDVLNDEGHRVLIAANGKDALKFAGEQRPDLILTDFMMPVMDGAAFIQALLANSDLNQVPVILMSSLPEEAVAERCAGYALFVRKPFKIFDVVDVVAQFVDREPAPRA